MCVCVSYFCGWILISMFQTKSYVMWTMENDVTCLIQYGCIHVHWCQIMSAHIKSSHSRNTSWKHISDQSHLFPNHMKTQWTKQYIYIPTQVGSGKKCQADDWCFPQDWLSLAAVMFPSILGAEELDQWSTWGYQSQIWIKPLIKDWSFELNHHMYIKSMDLGSMDLCTHIVIVHKTLNQQIHGSPTMSVHKTTKYWSCWSVHKTQIHQHTHCAVRHLDRKTGN